MQLLFYCCFSLLCFTSSENGNKLTHTNFFLLVPVIICFPHLVLLFAIVWCTMHVLVLFNLRSDYCLIHVPCNVSHNIGFTTIVLNRHEPFFLKKCYVYSLKLASLCKEIHYVPENEDTLLLFFIISTYDIQYVLLSAVTADNLRYWNKRIQFQNEYEEMIDFHRCKLYNINEKNKMIELSRLTMFHKTNK